MAHDHLMTLEVDWVDVPAGSLQRGTPEDEVQAVVDRYREHDVLGEWILKECPRSEIFVAAFRIARTPVTVGQWTAFARDGGGPPVNLTAPMQYPVTGVPWQAAVEFCGWLSERLGAAVRLPREDEWERAARGDDTREYPWGDEYRKGLANLGDLGLGGTTQVGSFPGGASPFGVLDMAGNVEEWTATEFAPYPGAPDVVSRREDQAGVDPHVTRGGDWIHAGDLARCARRHRAFDPRLVGVGLRIVADV